MLSQAEMDRIQHGDTPLVRGAASDEPHGAIALDMGGMHDGNGLAHGDMVEGMAVPPEKAREQSMAIKSKPSKVRAPAVWLGVGLFAWGWRASCGCEHKQTRGAHNPMRAPPHCKQLPSKSPPPHTRTHRHPPTPSTHQPAICTAVAPARSSRRRWPPQTSTTG